MGLTALRVPSVKLWELSDIARTEKMAMVIDQTPCLPQGLRVVTLDLQGKVLPWEWEDRVQWESVIAFKPVEGEYLDQCALCLEFAVSCEGGFCDDCLTNGEEEA